jgi:excisionase family DNA binding protein
VRDLHLEGVGVNQLLLTVEEAAGVLAVSRRKLYGLLQAGELESVRLGSCRRIPAGALVEYVERLRVSPRTWVA